MNCTTPYPISSSELMKKGRRAGNTIFHQALTPALEASKTSAGKVTIQKTKKTVPIITGIWGDLGFLRSVRIMTGTPVLSTRMH